MHRTRGASGLVFVAVCALVVSEGFMLIMFFIIFYIQPISEHGTQPLPDPYAKARGTG